MHNLPPLIQDLAVILGVASLVTLLFQKIRQPVVLGYLVAGIIIGPYTPPHILITSVSEIKVLSELGVIFLMFSIGLDFSFHKLVRVGFSASITGIVEVLLMLGLGFLTGKLLGWPFYESLFLGAAIAISSTMIILKALDELKLRTKRFAEFIFGILVVEDLLAVLLLVALSTVVATKNIFSIGMVWALLKLIFVVGGWFLVGYFVVPSFFRGIMKFASKETLVIVSIALCLMLVTVAAYFNYSPALGAFIMGSILAETPLVGRIEKLTNPIRDIFAAVFFVSVGMLINPMMIMKHFPVVILISAIIIIGKTITVTIGSFLTGQSFNTSLRIGLGMAQIGEFSFIIAGMGVTLGVISDDLYPIIVAVSAITAFTTPYRLRFSGYLVDQLDKYLPERIKFFLANYSAWVYRTLATSKTQSMYVGAFARIVLNGIIVIIVFTATQNFILPEIIIWIHHKQVVALAAWMVAMFLSSPFIWGMLFALSPARLAMRRKDVVYFSTPIIFCWLVTLVEISILSIAYFHAWITASLVLIFMIVFMILGFKRLERSYQWFEKRLVNNISLNGNKHDRYNQLAPWDKHFVEIEVSEHSSLVGKPLIESHPRQTFGINIVAIYRSGKEVLAPRGDCVILPHDKLIILGDDNQIDAFHKIASPPFHKCHEPVDVLKYFELKAFVLDTDNVIEGKTIRDSGIREKVKGLVVGLERNGKQILNPDPATVLQSGDLVLLVGEGSYLKEL